MSVVTGPKITVMDKADTGDAYGVPMRKMFRMLQALVQPNVRAVNQNTPPGSPSNGDTYTLGASPTGAWSGFPNCVAYWTTDNPDSGAPPNGWDFYQPLAGWEVYNDTDNKQYIWNGTTWVLAAASSGFSGLSSGTNTTAAMIVGTGASLTVTGSGAIQASQIQAVVVSGTPPTTGQVLVATSPTSAAWQAISGVGTVTSVTGAGLVTGTVTSSGSLTVTGSGNTTTAATAAANLAAAVSGRVLTADGSGNVQSSSTALTSLAPLASPTFTGTVTLPSGTYAISISGNAASISGTILYGQISNPPQLAVTFTPVAHSFLTGYSSTTGVFSSAQPAAADLANGTTGSGAVVLASGPTLTGLTTTMSFKTSVAVISFSATPAFNAAVGNNFKITLTGDVTSSTLTSAASGQVLTFQIIQDGTGGRAFTWPANVLNGMSITSGLLAAGAVSIQQFYYDGTNAYATTPGMIYP